MMTDRRSRKQHILHGVGTFAAISVCVVSMPARGDVTFTPSADIRQVVNDNTSDGRSARGWLELGAGFDLAMDTRRADARVTYRYARRIEEFGNIRRNNRHNANANVSSMLIDDFLFLDAGGSASQYATDIRGYSSINNDDDSGNQTQIFSGYVQPSINQRFGNFANFSANYRLGAVSADSPRDGLSTGGSIGLDPADGLGSLLSDSVTHSGGVTLASTRGTNTVNWSLTGTATREDVDQLNQEYRGYSGGGEVGVQVSRKLELLGSAGYEDILNTQDSILFDDLTGLPVLDPDGKFQIDPTAPRRTAYDFDGVYWNAGFRYAPSRRTSLELRGGERYGQLNVFADFTFEARNGTLVRANFQQSLSSFSRLLTQSFNGMVFDARRVGGIDAFALPFCILGIDPASPDGECLLGLTQSVTPATFRSDRGSISISRQVRSLTWSAMLFYDQRRYLDEQQLQSPNQPQLPPGILGDDESFGARGRLSYRLSDDETLGFDLLASRNSFTLSQDRKDYNATAGTTYSRQLGARLHATSSLYASRRFTSNRKDGGTVTASVGLQYRF